jgi:hypothetical protein
MDQDLWSVGDMGADAYERWMVPMDKRDLLGGRSNCGEGSDAHGMYNQQAPTSITMLALIMQYQGKYNEAEKLNQRALTEREKELGVHHLDTLASVSNLASVLQY